MSRFKEIIVQELLIALEEFGKHFKNEEAFEIFLANHGWNANISNADLSPIKLAFNLESHISSLQTFAEDLEGGALDPIDLIESFVDGVKTLVELFRSLDTVSTSGLLYPLSESDFWSELGQSLVDELIVGYLCEEQRTVYSILYFFQVIEYEHVTPADPARIPFFQPKINWNKLGTSITDPIGRIKDVYKWNHDTDPFDHVKLLEALEHIFISLGIGPQLTVPRASLTNDFLDVNTFLSHNIKELEIPLFHGTSDVDQGYYKVGFLMMPIPSANNASTAPEGLLFQPLIEGLTSVSIPVGNGLEFKITTSVNLDDEVRLKLFPGNTEWETNFASTEVGIELAFEGQPDTPWLLIGTEEASRIEVEGLKIALGMAGAINDPEFYFVLGTGDEREGEFPKIIFTADFSEGDGFLNKIFGDEEQQFDIGGAIRWSSVNGLMLNGGAGLELKIPIHKEIGPVLLEDIIIAVSLSSAGGTNALRGVLAVNMKVILGPFTAVVQEMGVKVLGTPKENNEEPGLFGNLDLDFGFKPPIGIGLKVEGDTITGGGFLSFDFDDETYIGAMELSIEDEISLKAVAILTTKLPGQDDGYSLLILITAEFQPVNLGLGFTLNGVGGIIALHRTMDFDFLRAGVKANTLDNILFPDDPIGNINQIVSDLDGAFPIEEGRFSFGPMALIGWGTPTLITLELGLMIELPSPVRLAILGVLKAILPTEEDAQLKLQINFLGTLDFEAKEIKFDASLFDSKLMSFTLSGDMVFRMKWGDNPNFLFSIGGFHPAYTPPPLDLPTINRLTLNLVEGDNPRLTLTTYFALTSNTLQFGANVDFYYQVTENIRVVGFLGFDVLIRFNPFYLMASLGASLAVIRKDKTLFGVYLAGSLEGPAPWRAKGEASFEVCGIEFSVDFDKTFGEDKETELPDVEVLPLLQEAVAHKDNWQGLLPDNTHLMVSIREVDATNGETVVHPYGALGVNQKICPLDFTMNKFGTQRPGDYSNFSIVIEKGSGGAFAQEDIKDFFAPAEFTHLTTGQSLSRKSFEKYNSGVIVTGSEVLSSDYFLQRALEYEQVVLDTRNRPDRPTLHVPEKEGPFNAFTNNTPAGKSPLGRFNKPDSEFAPPSVTVNQERYSIANLDDMSVYNGLEASSEAEAVSMLEELYESDPSLRPLLQVVPSFELV
jgi:hypothetical protein